MAKSPRPAWVGKLLKQLKRAKEKDPDFSRFGAYSHKYQLKPPAVRSTHHHAGAGLPGLV